MQGDREEAVIHSTFSYKLTFSENGMLKTHLPQPLHNLPAISLILEMANKNEPVHDKMWLLKRKKTSVSTYS